MENTLKKAEKRKTKGDKIMMAPAAYALIACTLLVAGCEKSLPMSLKPPEAVSAAALIPEAVQIVEQGLSDANPLVRVNAVEVVGTTRRIILMPKVQRLLKDEVVPVVFAATLAVGDSEYSLAKNEVVHLLKSKNENIRIAAGYAMNKFGSLENAELVRRAITSNDQTVRANAALLLGKSNNKDFLKFLYWALRHQDSDDKVRLQALEAIAMLGDERIYPKLWAMLISAYADDRVMGIKAMGELGSGRAKDALLTMLDDEVLEVRLAAAEQLGMLGNTAGETKVLDVFKKNLTAGLDKEDLERVNMRLALAIGQIRTDSLTRFLPLLLKNESKFVRLAAAKAVFQCAMKK